MHTNDVGLVGRASSSSCQSPQVSILTPAAYPLREPELLRVLGGFFHSKLKALIKTNSLHESHHIDKGAGEG